MAVRTARDLDGDLSGGGRAHPSLRRTFGGGTHGVQAVERPRGTNASADVCRRAERRASHGDEGTVTTGRPTGREVRVEWVLRPAPEVAPGLEKHAGLGHRGTNEEDGYKTGVG